jgi:hypothetical protein
VTITSRLPALIDYLINLFTTAPTIGGATPPVMVYDGPVTTEAPDQLILYVGLSDPDSDEGQPAGEFTQEWGALGRLARNETITIHCCAVAWNGVDPVQSMRVAVTGIVAAVESVMQADTTQFGGNVLFPAPGITSGVLMQNNTSTGAVAQLAFDLIFQSRIGG